MARTSWFLGSRMNRFTDVWEGGGLAVVLEGLCGRVHCEGRRRGGERTKIISMVLAIAAVEFVRGRRVLERWSLCEAAMGLGLRDTGMYIHMFGVRPARVGNCS